MEPKFGLDRLFGHAEESPPAEICDDLLMIDCRGCGYAPVPGSRECLGCKLR